MTTIPKEPIKPSPTIYLSSAHTLEPSTNCQAIMDGVAKIRKKYPDAQLVEIELNIITDYDDGIEDVELYFSRTIANANYDAEMFAYETDLAAYNAAVQAVEDERKAAAKAEEERLAARKSHKDKSHNERLAKRLAEQKENAEEVEAIEAFRAKWKADRLAEQNKEKTTNANNTENGPKTP